MLNRSHHRCQKWICSTNWQYVSLVWHFFFSFLLHTSSFLIQNKISTKYQKNYEFYSYQFGYEAIPKIDDLVVSVTKLLSSLSIVWCTIFFSLQYNLSMVLLLLLKAHRIHTKLIWFSAEITNFEILYKRWRFKKKNYFRYSVAETYVFSILIIIYFMLWIRLLFIFVH